MEWCAFFPLNRVVEMARKQSKAAKKRTHKRRQQRGGGWGFTGAGSAPGTPGTVSNPMVYSGIGDCRAVRPAYDIPYSQYGASLKGLPGMSGGAKTRKGMRKNKSRKQKGGRYGFFPQGDPNASGQAWWAGSYAPIQRIGCEGGSFNPLNPTHTGSSAPPGAANPNYWMAKGGAQSMAPATYGVGNVDSMYYYAPTGGYANNASTWKDSVGAPVQIQVPYAARSMNQACLTTGGAPPLTGALQQGGSMAATSQRGGKRNKKGTRKGRKQRGGDGVLNTVLGFAKKYSPFKTGITGSEASAPGEGALALGNITGKVSGTAGIGNAYEELNNGNSTPGAVAASKTPLPASTPSTPSGSFSSGNGNGNGMNGNGNPPLPAMPGTGTGGRRRKHKKSKSRKH